MNSLIHPVAPEEVMALLDGALTVEEEYAVQAHIEGCAECAALRDELRGTTEALRQWTIPALSEEIDPRFQEKIGRARVKRIGAKPQAYTPLSFRNWRLWAIGGGGAVAALLGLVLFTASLVYYDYAPRKSVMAELQTSSPDDSANSSVSTFANANRSDSVASSAATAGMQQIPMKGKSVTQLATLQPGIVGGAGAVPSPAVTQPMIARSASLTVLAKNFETAQTEVESILNHHHGYAADLTILDETPPRGLQASLRVPAAELPAVLTDLRLLGHVEKESQSGEEVTQQHTDTAARLTNARETEARLRDILAHRTGKMEEILDVEEKISETQGEIEQLEAEQKMLDHRVDFAAIDLKVVEEYKATLGDGARQSVGTQMHNSLIAGLQHGGGSLLALLLFFEEYGPALVLWAVIIGGPVWLIWRVWRRRTAGL